MRTVSLLGSTGSIGTQTCDVIAKRLDQFQIVALAAGGTQPQLLATQVAQFKPQLVAVANPGQVEAVEQAIAAITDHKPKIQAGAEAVLNAATVAADVVVNAITGAAGLQATLAILETDSICALANKESLVIGGTLVTKAAKPGQLVAIDSEHSAIAQALRAGRKNEVDRIILTASGGPFRGYSQAQLSQVTVQQALSHPTWNMGRVITINSATLVNKGLELIEAALLYDVSYDQIEVVVHPQSVVHSAVEFVDGSTIAQMSMPDMRLPIALSLDWPRRIAAATNGMNWQLEHTLTFEPLDNQVFPAVELARTVGKLAGVLPAVYNGANEVCVDAFCAGKLSFPEITQTIARVVEDAQVNLLDMGWNLEAVLTADAWARKRAAALMEGK